MRLKDKVVVVAGGGCAFGMGRGFPEKFAEEGANVVINYRNPRGGKIDEFADSLRSRFGVQVDLVQGDVSQEEVAEKLINTAYEKYGRIDVLLNNQAIDQEVSIVDMTFEDWRRIMSVNLDSYFLTCHYVLPIMIRQRYGRIINVASQLALKGGVGFAHYIAAKGGIVAFTKCLAREAGDYNITANCIAPGPIDTVMMAGVTDEWTENKLKELVLHRMGKIEEVVPTAIFLASEPDGNLYTGQVLGPNQGDVMP